MSFVGRIGSPSVKRAINATAAGSPAITTPAANADVAATLELVRDGVVWCRIDGWVDRRFESDAALFDVFRWPEKKSLGRQLADDVLLVDEPCHDSASRELLMRRYLTREERADYEAARRSFEEAVRLSQSPHGAILFSLAMTHWQLGNNTHSERPLAPEPYHD